MRLLSFCLFLAGLVQAASAGAQMPVELSRSAGAHDGLERVSRRSATSDAGRRVLHVGPSRELSWPSDAAAVADDGDIVEIDAGIYRGDVAGWRQSGLTIRAAGGPVIIDADGRGFEGKAAWVVSGDEVTIEGIELTGCIVSDHNGAAIRAEGSDLTLRAIHAHHNEMGILVSQDFRGQLLVERSEINDNATDHERFGTQPGHNIYMSGGERLVVLGSWIHDPHGGHNVKSRARDTIVAYSRIEDGEGGTGSYQIDVSEGGEATIIGNLVTQGARPENTNIIAFAPEGGASKNRRNHLEVAYNTIVNLHGSGVFLHNFSSSPAAFYNNLLIGQGEIAVGPSDQAGNVRSLGAAVGNPAAENAGIEPGSRPGFDLVASYEYRHPMMLVERRVVGPRPDAGAFDVAR